MSGAEKPPFIVEIEAQADAMFLKAVAIAKSGPPSPEKSKRLAAAINDMNILAAKLELLAHRLSHKVVQ